MTEGLQKFLQHLREFGLVYQRKVSSEDHVILKFVWLAVLLYLLFPDLN
jgi:hypothetical protein